MRVFKIDFYGFMSSYIKNLTIKDAPSAPFAFKDTIVDTLEFYGTIEEYNDFLANHTDFRVNHFVLHGEKIENTIDVLIKNGKSLNEINSILVDSQER